jgi:addiction module RelB/DinJ family antitoxin
MKTAVINIKTDEHIKAQAKKVATQLGLSLSGLINAYLRQLVKSKTVYFSLRSEEPTEHLLRSLAQSERDRKSGRVSPTFDSAEDAVAWLKRNN